MRKRTELNDNWEFVFSYKEGFERGEGECDGIVRLPHTCRETPFDYFDESCYQTVCAYRRMVKIPQGADHHRAFLVIGAAAHCARVFVDGQQVGDEHLCGYTAFETDITKHLTEGKESLVCIVVDSRETRNVPPFGNVVDYMTYGGLYREVCLELRDSSYIGSLFLRPMLPDGVTAGTDAGAVSFDGLLNADTEVIGEYDTLRLTVSEYESGRELCRSDFPKGEDISLTVPGARLWDITSPVLYRCRAELIIGGKTIDEVSDHFGFRSIRFSRGGFYLNGRRVQLRGLNRHQSYPNVGYAMPRSIQRLDAEILKNELGLNCVRTSHYPQSPHFITRCDELGLLVFTEIPGWQHIGDEQWQDIAVHNTEEMVRQYRNHPSVMLWGVRINESADNDEFYRRTNETARRLDPTRPTTGVRFLKKSSLLEDVYAYNDFTHNGKNKGCEKRSRVTPDSSKGYFISEYCGHMYPVKSFDEEAQRLELALRHTRIINDAAKQPEIAGTFGWCFADYNTHREFGSGDRICWHGVCDMYRNPKLAAAVYSSQQDERPFLRLSTSGDIGDHPEGLRGIVYLFTNCDSVRLYRGEKLICEYGGGKREFPYLPHSPIRVTDIVGDSLKAEGRYSPAQQRRIARLLNESSAFGSAGMSLGAYIGAGLLILSGVSYAQVYELYGKYIGGWGKGAVSLRFEGIKDGRSVIERTVAPFEEMHLEAELSSDILYSSQPTYDCAAVRLRMTDQNGNVLPYYFGAVRAEAQGPIELYGSDCATLRGGMGGLYIRTTGGQGSAALTLTAENGEALRLPIIVK